MSSKPFYQSKTFWTGVISFVLAIAKIYGIEGIDAGKYDQAAELIAAGVAFIALRKATKQPMHFVAPKDGQ